jgi:ribonuclease BN (tRNA processing enzyme)
MIENLLHSSDDALLSVMSEADDLDEVISERRLSRAAPTDTAGDYSLEVTILGALGCRLGMLNGEAGGFLLRLAGTCLLVDPGPAALYFLSRLEKEGKFLFSELDAILCSHIHTDHATDLLPCIEGMTGGMRDRRGYVIGNRTVIDRFTAFSPYHLARVQPVVLVPGTSEDEMPRESKSEPLSFGVSVKGLEVRATPTQHLEEGEKWDTGIGFLIQSQTTSVWYTSDTNRFDDLLQQVKSQIGERRLTLAIANADASDIKQRPGKAESCHLLTRDVPEIAREIKPHYIMIQHYDEAYSSPRYRIAQAIYLQRLVNRLGLDTVILPSASGLQLSFDGSCLKEHEMRFESEEGIVVKEYIERQGGGQYA